MILPEEVNIISKSFTSGHMGGPYKVAANTIKGLQNIGQPYRINGSPLDFKYNWVHDDPYAFIELTYNKRPFLAGPNIFALPADFPIWTTGNNNSIYLHPSEWTRDFWRFFGYNGNRLEIWSAGIDTEEFKPRGSSGSYRNVLLYFKKRDPSFLQITEEIIRSLGYNPLVIKYGSYSEEKYKETLLRCKFGVWIGTTESQGIALLEALSANLPLVVLNSTNILENDASEITDLPKSVGKFKASTVPYFDPRCGIVIDNMVQLRKAIEDLAANLQTYAPRKYVLDGFTLSAGAKNLLKYFNTLNFDNLNPKSHRSFNTRFKISISSSELRARRIFRILRRRLLNSLRRRLI